MSSVGGESKHGFNVTALFLRQETNLQNGSNCFEFLTQTEVRVRHTRLTREGRRYSTCA